MTDPVPAPLPRLLVSLRPLRADDVPAVAELERLCFTSHWTESAFLSELGNRAAYYNVALCGDLVVGYAGMWCIMDEAHITSLGVRADWRRQGIGERLLLDLLVEADRRYARRATLEVRRSNEAAIRLYEKYGFRAAAIRRGYYTDTNEDALILWIDDLHSPAIRAIMRRRVEDPAC